MFLFILTFEVNDLPQRDTPGRVIEHSLTPMPTAARTVRHSGEDTKQHHQRHDRKDGSSAQYHSLYCQSHRATAAPSQCCPCHATMLVSLSSAVLCLSFQYLSHHPKNNIENIRTIESHVATSRSAVRDLRWNGSRRVRWRGPASPRQRSGRAYW